MPSRPALVAALVAIVTATVGLAWNTRAAGGSDSYGYVSQAYAWLSGGPPIAEPTALELRELRVRDAGWVAAPLGYRPGLRAGELAPIYPPGLPLLMAGAIAALGPQGAFLISPLAGTLAVWCTFLLARRVTTPLAGACAAALLAANPTFLYQLVQPMSDVPVTALWTACLVLACRTRWRDWIGAGLLAGIAIAVRPNLAPLTALAVLVSIGAAADDRRLTPRHSLAAAGAITAPALAAFAWILSLNRAWYGAATASGYGTADQLFALAHVPLNTVRYGRAILETNPVVVPLALAAAAALGARGVLRRPRLVSLALVGWCAGVIALYLPYLSFPEWWYTRFLLPAYPAALALATSVLARAAAEWRLPRAVTTTVLACALAAGVWIARDRGTFALQHGEAKYEDAARWVDRLLPPNAIVLAMTHGGSLRLYAHRTTLRWDRLRPEDFDSLVVRLERRGRGCYAVLDPDERGPFRARFDGTRAQAGRLFTTPFGVDVMAISSAGQTR